jgi:deaminated glutathione amidase
MRVALYQSNSGIDPAVNAGALCDAIEQAKGEGADMLFSPEMVGYLDRNRARADQTLRNEAEDRTLAAAREAAARHSLWVHLGSLGLRDERSDGRWVNRSFVIDDTGAIRARYDKIHLFDVDLPTGESWRESAVYGPGEAVVAVDTPWARMGMSICYDLRFPDLYRKLSDAGARILLVPAAFTRPTGEAHWHVMLRARAIEAGAFVIAPAQAGDHADGRSTYGHSLVVDSWGDVLLDMQARRGIACVDIDFAFQDDVRARIPALQHRRLLPDSVTIL